MDPRQVAAIAFDSQMAGIGSIDEDYLPATRFDFVAGHALPAVHHLDRPAGRRPGHPSHRLPAHLRPRRQRCCGGKHERPQDYRRIAKFVTPAGYVAGRMAGLEADQAFMDYTFIHFSGFSDAQAGAWSDELCQQLGMDREKLPRIVAPWEVIGEVTKQAAADLGWRQGTAIAAGCGDTAASALGAGIVAPGDAV